MNRILIIDDDARNIYALQAVLKAKGFTSLCAASVKEGIATLQQHPEVQVILLDMMMPETDGYEAIQLLRHLPGRANLPIIAVTAQAMVGDREKCLAAGASAYVSKPIDMDLLLGQLKNYLSV
ncbi:response regulator [Chitinophaga parva]|uniref:Response regulator n=1 Tax=Chitinophaga parva TaxID=2169414 RepID=A0A2T7BI85_9BACT|nr:response regulator [Chitinophaga parva]PUZ25963.1 response regulator [Chitinophaga parva]